MRNLTVEAEQVIEQANRLKAVTEKQAGIDSEKVQQTVSDYIRIARDNRLNYNELLQVFAITKDTVLQSLNKLSISTLPAAISDDANE